MFRRNDRYYGRFAVEKAPNINVAIMADTILIILFFFITIASCLDCDYSITTLYDRKMMNL